jgi:neuropeptide Y receptor
MNLNLNHFQKQNNNKKVTNFFIVNMAAGDILMAIFCIPFTFVPTFILLYWPFGAVMCRVVSFSQAVSVFVSAYTMVAISSDRYLAIVYPLRPRMTRKQAKVQLFKLKNIIITQQFKLL